MRIGMYADQTNMFTEEELNHDNWIEADIPEEILRKWYEVNNLADVTAHELRKPIEECTFEDWYKKVSWGGDTDGLWNFAVNNGATPKIISSPKTNELYFQGWGYFRVNTGNYDEAVDRFLKAAADAGIDITLDKMELRDLDGNVIEEE